MEVQGAHTRPVGLSGVLPEVRLTLPGWPRRGGRTGAVNVTGCQSPASVLTALELQKRQAFLGEGRHGPQPKGSASPWSVLAFEEGLGFSRNVLETESAPTPLIWKTEMVHFENVR